MTVVLSPTCSLGATAEPACAKRLVLRECLERWQRDATHGVFDTGRYRCRYVVWGNGPPLVLIPGIACDTSIFAMLVARLHPYFRCISYELPDGGADGACLRTYRHEDFASDLLALLGHLQIRSCSMLGFSFGSTIALDALQRAPARFERAVLQGGFAHRPLSTAEAFCASWARFLPGRLSHVPMMRRILESNHRAPFLAREPEVWDYFVAAHQRGPLAAFAARALMVHRLDLRLKLPAIRQPVLLVCGDRDPLIGKTCADELRRGLPMVAHAEIEQCGHLPQLTHPEVLAEVILSTWTAFSR